jgi:hypothetical protein
MTVINWKLVHPITGMEIAISVYTGTQTTTGGGIAKEGI